MYHSYKIKTNRKGAMLLGGGIAIFALFNYLYTQGLLGFNNHPTLKFTPELWAQHRKTRSKYLNWMAKDLSKSKILVGLDKEKIVEILGEPDQYNYNDFLKDGLPNSDPKDIRELVYYLSHRSTILMLPLSDEYKVKKVIYGSTGGP